MQAEKRICQNCKNDFTIESDDFGFYEKIKVPPPTFCPECRTVRRLCWRNEMSLYKRKCSAENHDENIISIYHPDEKLTVYDLKEWWSDDWDPMKYGKSYDFSRPFFEQWKELHDIFPLQTLSNSKAHNSDYCNVAEESRDSFMCSGSWDIERTLYSNRIAEVKDSSDLYIVHNSELCYENVLCSESYRLFYSLKSKSCVDSYFLYDCVGCTNCFGCSNLRSKAYCMWNEQLTREEYLSRISQLDLQNYNTISEMRQKFNDLCLKSIHRCTNQIKAINSSGDNLDGVKNCKIAFDAKGAIEDSKYIHWVAMGAKDLYDSGPGIGLLELGYEVFDSGLGNYRNIFGSVIYSSNDIEYTFNCYGCSNLFGCIGLRDKKYCILNKQYTKEEYNELVPKIKKHMDEMPFLDKKGIIYKYGEFFPQEFSPFAYNETVAQDYFPLTKDETIKIGYRWRERQVNDYKITIKSEDLPVSLKEVNESIVQEVISCLHDGKCQDRCSTAFKINLDEYNLYKRLGVPLPRLCFGCRHEMRLKLRNPMKLWHRKCMCDKKHANHEGKCEVEFKTSYAPERPEIVYCEKCYQTEVY